MAVIDRDVVIVGAGLSGLASAVELLDAGVDSTVVLEANTRVGGRTLNAETATVTLDAGATLVYPAHRHIRQLARKFGIPLFDTVDSGRFLFDFDGAVRPFDFGDTRIPSLPRSRVLRKILRAIVTFASRWVALPMEPQALIEVALAIERLDELASAVPRDAPWDAPDADALDHCTVGAWFEQSVPNRQARGLLESLFGYFPPTASLLFVLHLFNTWGGIGSLLASQTSVLRFPGGTQSLSLAIADQLGARLVLDTPVSRIERSADDVFIHSGETTYRARHVIVAASPAACQHITFTPALPAAAARLRSAWQPVHGRKINAVYDKPFWRAAGLSGSAMTDSAAVPGVLDASPPDGSVGVLASYLTDEPGNPGGDAATSKQAVLDTYARLFGPQARYPYHYEEKRWRDEPFSFGCEGGLPTGVLTSARTSLKTPVGRLHWAGVETADEWIGFMNGAVQAGARAAREVVRAL